MKFHSTMSDDTILMQYDFARPMQMRTQTNEVENQSYRMAHPYALKRKPTSDILELQYNR